MRPKVQVFACTAFFSVLFEHPASKVVGDCPTKVVGARTTITHFRARWLHATIAQFDDMNRRTSDTTAGAGFLPARRSLLSEWGIAQHSAAYPVGSRSDKGGGHIAPNSLCVSVCNCLILSQNKFGQSAFDKIINILCKYKY